MERVDPKSEPPPAADPWPEDFDPESIDHDESLILSFLEKTPTERLAVLQDFVDFRVR